ncbi:MAG: hypothetical protein ACRDCE_06995, partial [Cetobacterium sp.]|uniref:hypothetical protein n=1 Tax=Cetobacterium sp. TaxID=2071632 RepID=UPI003EE72296
MIYTVFTCDANGQNPRQYHHHDSAPCWGRLSTGYISLNQNRRVSHVIWTPVLRFANGAIANIDEARQIMQDFIDKLGGNQFEIMESRDSLKIKIHLFNYPKSGSLLKMFMIRNVLEYVGCAGIYKHLRSKNIPIKLAMYVGASCYCNVGPFG